MGVSSADWPAIDELTELAPGKVIPCFGIHPWKAHLYASRLFTGNVARVAELAASACETQPADAELMETKLQEGWQTQLEERLTQNPRAIVGECGLDRAARIPGTKASTSYEHQWDLMMAQFEVAARFNRPVSLHCVRAYGHLQDMLRELDESACPPRIMLHSYGGSAELIASLLRIGSGSPSGVGQRLYFSFSTVINGKTPAKMLARIKAVPDERLLLESDQTEIAEIDRGLVRIVQAVAEAKGWSEAETIERCWVNFLRFYDGHVPDPV